MFFEEYAEVVAKFLDGHDCSYQFNYQTIFSYVADLDSRSMTGSNAVLAYSGDK